MVWCGSQWEDGLADIGATWTHQRCDQGQAVLKEGNLGAHKRSSTTWTAGTRFGKLAPDPHKAMLLQTQIKESGHRLVRMRCVRCAQQVVRPGLNGENLPRSSQTLPECIRGQERLAPIAQTQSVPWTGGAQACCLHCSAGPEKLEAGLEEGDDTSVSVIDLGLTPACDGNFAESSEDAKHNQRTQLLEHGAFCASHAIVLVLEDCPEELDTLKLALSCYFALGVLSM